MSEAHIYLDAQIQVRRDTEANWAAVDPVLRDGEMAYSRDINRIKIGDGAHKWSELKYMLSIGLSEYYTREEVDNLIKEIKKITDHFFYDEKNSAVATNKNLYSTGTVASGGAAQVGQGGGSSGGTTGEYKMYTHTQGDPLKEWTITHNLNKVPNVKVIDSTGQQVYGDVKIENMNVVIVSFGGAFSGIAYLD